MMGPSSFNRHGTMTFFIKEKHGTKTSLVLIKYPWDEHFFKNELQFPTQEEQLLSLNIFYLKKK